MSPAGGRRSLLIDGPHATTRVAIAATLAFLLAACSPDATTSPSIRPATAAPSQPAVIPCALTLADGHPAAQPPPGTAPVSLPIDLVADGAAIYGLTLPQAAAVAPDTVYLVGPTGGTCEGQLGGGLDIRVLDAHGDVVIEYLRPGGVGPNQELACAYIAAARRGAEREWGSLDPGACVPNPGDRVTGIATGVSAAHLTIVVSSASLWLGAEMAVPTASLYSFTKDAGDDRGSSWRATCSLPAVPASTCLATFAFLAGATPVTLASMSAALGLPAAPAS